MKGSASGKKRARSQHGYSRTRVLALYIGLLFILGISTLFTLSSWLSSTDGFHATLKRNRVEGFRRENPTINDNSKYIAQLRAFQNRLAKHRSSVLSGDTEISELFSPMEDDDTSAASIDNRDDELRVPQIRNVHEIVKGVTNDLILEQNEMDFRHIDKVAQSLAASIENSSSNATDQIPTGVRDLDFESNISSALESEESSTSRVSMSRAHAAGLTNQLLVYRIIRTPGVAVRAQPSPIGQLSRGDNNSDARKVKHKIYPMIDFVTTHSLVVGVKVVNRFGLWLKLSPKRFVPISIMASNGRWVDAMKKVMALTIPKAFTRILTRPIFDCSDQTVLAKHFPVQHKTIKSSKRQLRHCLDRNEIHNGVVNVVRSFQLEVP